MKKNNENGKPHVRLPWEMMDSASYKTLSTNAVWLFSQILRQFRASQGGYSHLVLPFADVKYKLTWKAFSRARAELIICGFIWLVREGGLKGLLTGQGGATVYAAGQGKEFGERWKLRSAALTRDPQAGQTRRIRRLADDERPRVVWEPTKTITRKASRENWRKAVKAMERKKRYNTHLAWKKGVGESQPLTPH